MSEYKVYLTTSAEVGEESPEKMLSKEVKTYFVKTVALLDEVKRLWWLYQYICENPEIFSGLIRRCACRLQRRLATLLRKVKLNHSNTVIDIEALASVVSGLNEVHISDGLRMGDVCNDILDKAEIKDTPFYVEERYGKFWNEVELPTCVEDFFCNYVDALTPHVSGLIGVENSSMVLDNRAAAISYYDLSDTAVVFTDEESALAFADENGVDPSDLMGFRDDGWVGL